MEKHEAGPLGARGLRPRAARLAWADWALLALLALGLPGAGARPPAEVEAPQFTRGPDVPRGVVASLAQDHSGFLWLGTGDGLARFDGQRLQYVEREGPTPAARNLGWIRALAAGEGGRVWIGTETDGLAVYEPELGRVRTLGHAAQHPPGALRAIATDAEGQVWMGGLGGGLQVYDPRRQAFAHHALEAQVLALAVDGPTVWVGHTQGLSRWRAGQLQPVLGPERGAVQALLRDRAGRIWLGTSRGAVGFLPTLDAPPPPPQAANHSTLLAGSWLALPGLSRVAALAQDAEGRIWVGHTQGLHALDASTGRVVQRIQHQPHRPGGLAGNDVSALLHDRDGHLWVAGFGVGLQRHAAHPAWWVRGADADPASPMGRPDVRTLLTLQDGQVLAGLHAGDLVRLNPQGRVEGVWAPDRDLPAEALAQDPSGRVWVADAQGLERRTADGRLQQRWPLPWGQVVQLRWTGDTAEAGRLWAVTRTGLYRLAPEATAPERLVAGEVLCIEPDGTGDAPRLWVGTGRGLHLWDGSALRQPVLDPAAALGFPAVVGLLRDRKGQLWVDTQVAGLHRLKGRDVQGRLQFDRVSERHGRVGRPFGVNLREDGRGRIWSQHFVHDPEADSLHEIGPADGAQFGTAWFHAHARLPDGRLLFGGSQGLLVVQPEAYRPQASSPALAFTHLRVPGSLQPVHVPPDGLVLEPGQRSFGVEFTALEYAEPARLRYRYRLEGVDADWVETDASFRNPTYSNLAPGRYLLRVRATDRHGSWGQHELLLPVHVQRAGWAHPAVLVALGLVLMLLFWGAWRWRLRGLQRESERLEFLVQERTAALKATSEALARESEALKASSLTDALTGLRNRRYLQLRIDDDVGLVLRQHESAAQRGETPPPEAHLTLLLFDLDHFKQINDRHGHDAGDAVLVQVGERLRAVLRDTDTLVRWGGEELLALARATRREQATDLAERCRAAVADLPFTLPDGRLIPASLSCGFAVFPLDPILPATWTWDALLRLADRALYDAKSRGRDTWVGVLQADGVSPETVDALGSLGDLDGLGESKFGDLEAPQRSEGLQVVRRL